MSAAKAVKQSAAVSADGSHKNVPMPESRLASVIIPCYNQAHFLHEAIESASAQTYSHREILVVDDGSTDNTAKVTASYPGVRYVRQENLGVASARNTGFKQSRGEYLVFLDADDRLLPEALRVELIACASIPTAPSLPDTADSLSRTDRSSPSPSSFMSRVSIIWNYFGGITFGALLR